MSKGHSAAGFKNLTPVNEALSLLLASVPEARAGIEQVRLSGCVGRVLGKDIIAQRYMPSENRSVVDGYAVQSKDTRNASVSYPIRLEAVGESVLGEVCRLRIRSGQTVAVATGSTMPTGADSVVPVEDSERLPGGGVTVNCVMLAGQNVVRKGDDVGPGKRVLSEGRRLRSEDLGILKALGMRRVTVRRLMVGIMATGNELVDSPKGLGKVVDMNRVVLSSMVAELGAVPDDLGIVADREPQLLEAIRGAVQSSDIVLVTGGSSVGERDLVSKCIAKLGRPGMLVHGVRMRPSMPTGFGLIGRKPVISLPGVPVSAIFAFRVFVRPLIGRLLGVGEEPDLVVKAELKERIRGSVGYRTFVRVVVRKTRGRLVAEPLRDQRSSILMSIVASNGFVTLPEDSAEVEVGEIVDVTLTGGVYHSG